ncbi:hypothetical protein WDU94_006395 [Cyamophila willieti]
MNAFIAVCLLVGAVSAFPQPQKFQTQPQQFQTQPQQFQTQPQQFQTQPQYLQNQLFQEESTPHTYIPILSKSEIHRPDGTFALKYQSADGQSFQENAQVVRNSDNTGDVLVKTGSYAYTAPDGTPISVSYIADEFGFRVSGNHLPVAPVAPSSS